MGEGRRGCLRHGSGIAVRTLRRRAAVCKWGAVADPSSMPAEPLGYPATPCHGIALTLWTHTHTHAHIAGSACPLSRLS